MDSSLASAAQIVSLQEAIALQITFIKAIRMSTNQGDPTTLYLGRHQSRWAVIRGSATREPANYQLIKHSWSYLINNNDDKKKKKIINK